jgi:tRNA(fMet)-specific endonuclease VapC
VTDSGLLLLDTSVVLHLIRGKATGEAIDRAFGLRARPDRPLISIITVGELLAFARQRGWGGARIDRLKTAVEELVVVDVRNQSVMDRYAEIDTFLVRRGNPVGDNDVWIAATAAAAGAVLLTTDRDFDLMHDRFLTRVYFDPNVASSSG